MYSYNHLPPRKILHPNIGPPRRREEPKGKRILTAEKKERKRKRRKEIKEKKRREKNIKEKKKRKKKHFRLSSCLLSPLPGPPPLWLSAPSPSYLIRALRRLTPVPPCALGSSRRKRWSLTPSTKALKIAATKPGEFCVWLPCVVSLGVASPLDLELGCPRSFAPANYTLDVVFGLAGARHVYWWGRGLGAAVVDLVAPELGYVALAADAQVLWHVEFEGIVAARLEQAMRTSEELLQGAAQPGTALAFPLDHLACRVYVAQRQVAGVQEHRIANLEIMRLSNLFAAAAVAAWDTFSASVSCWRMSFSLVARLTAIASPPGRRDAAASTSSGIRGFSAVSASNGDIPVALWTWLLYENSASAKSLSQ